jgi:hypothetical protein
MLLCCILNTGDTDVIVGSSTLTGKVQRVDNGHVPNAPDS